MTTDIRLEAVERLPLGTVLRDRTGVEHIFVGTKRNTVGKVYFFMPRVDAFSGVPMLWNCSLLSGALKKFPDITGFIELPPRAEHLPVAGEESCAASEMEGRDAHLRQRT